MSGSPITSRHVYFNWTDHWVTWTEHSLSKNTGFHYKDSGVLIFTLKCRDSVVPGNGSKYNNRVPEDTERSVCTRRRRRAASTTTRWFPSYSAARDYEKERLCCAITCFLSLVTIYPPTSSTTIPTSTVWIYSGAEDRGEVALLHEHQRQRHRALRRCEEEMSCATRGFKHKAAARAGQMLKRWFKLARSFKLKQQDYLRVTTTISRSYPESEHKTLRSSRYGFKGDLAYV